MTGRPHGRLRRWSALGVAAALFGLGACGVPLDDSPRAIDRTTTTQTTIANADANGNERTMTVYYLNKDRLAARQVKADRNPTVRDAVEAVLAPPSAPLRTGIPPETQLVDFTARGKTAIINLSKGIDTVEAQGQKQAYAQLVFTALASDKYDQVAFQVAGKPVSAPTDNGARDTIRTNDYDAPLNPGKN